MNKKFMILFFGIILISSFSFAQEEVTITTYYPSPYGVYNVLRLFPISAPATCKEGELYFNTNTHNLSYCDQAGAWKALTYWGTSGNNIYNTNIGNVGVGTSSIPQQKLEINGGARLNTATAQPACDENTRGTFWVTQGAAGVKDSVQVCAKDAAEAYAWRTIY